MLPQLSFEGATKRNRPNLARGDVVYARVVTASRDMEATLTCVDAAGRAAGMGALKEGTVVGVSTSSARRMLASPPPPVLADLGAQIPFELAAGVNGRVWVSCPEIGDLILVSEVLRKAEALTDPQTRTLVARMLSTRGSGGG